MAPLAAYDDRVPHADAAPELARRFAALRELRPPADLAAIRDVVIVVSSSRGGCTLLGELLRRCPGVLSLPAESNPYVVVAQLGADDPAGVVAGEIARAIGRPAVPPLDDADVRAYGLEWAWRVCAQWPDVDVDPEAVAGWVRAALPASPEAVAMRVVGRLRELDRRVDVARYDLGGDAFGPATEPGPPGELLVEMPPFVVPRPWRPARGTGDHDGTLVLATPRNAYRVAFLAGLFPAARVRVLHLVRNPAASINGLIDGWRHHGFFNCRVPVELNIRGYSELGPWGRSWWKYDVPPEWESVADRTLAEVCALQWRSAHRAALAARGDLGADHHVVRYEDLVGAADARESVARQLAAWLGLAEEDLVPLVVRGLAPVMATSAPRPGRWREREHELAPVIADDRTLAVASELGYDGDPREWA